MGRSRTGIGARGVGAFAALSVALALSACVEQATELAPVALAHRQIDRREGVTLAAATVAIISVEGAPAAVGADFGNALTVEAKSHDIVMVDAKKARYFVRGYLSATATKDGAILEYVWDVFGKDKSREQRLNDVIEVKGAGDDPWALADDAALTSVAARSADDLAAFLSNTPEAKPVALPPDARPLSYAPTQ